MIERLKQLRKHLGMTQQEFADKISIQRSTYSKYEVGQNEPTSAVIALICDRCHVNEDWLRNGIGEMFVEESDDVVARFARNNGLGRLEEVLLREYLDLSEAGRDVFRQYIRNVVAELLDAPAADQAEGDAPADASAPEAASIKEDPEPLIAVTDEEREAILEIRRQKEEIASAG